MKRHIIAGTALALFAALVPLGAHAIRQPFHGMAFEMVFERPSAPAQHFRVTSDQAFEVSAKAGTQNGPDVCSVSPTHAKSTMNSQTNLPEVIFTVKPLSAGHCTVVIRDAHIEGTMTVEVSVNAAG